MLPTEWLRTNRRGTCLPAGVSVGNQNGGATDSCRGRHVERVGEEKRTEGVAKREGEERELCCGGGVKGTALGVRRRGEDLACVTTCCKTNDAALNGDPLWECSGLRQKRIEVYRNSNATAVRSSSLGNRKPRAKHL